MSNKPCNPSKTVARHMGESICIRDRLSAEWGEYGLRTAR